MTKEQKEFLFKDICCRLPYGVKAYVRHYSKLDRKWYEGIYTIKSAYPYLNEIYVTSETGSVEVIVGYDDYEIKPYLFPMSSMIEEEKKEFIHCAKYEVEESVNGRHYEYYLKDYVGTPENPICNYDAIDWLNKNHFDYRGLIPMGLAKDATGLNIY